MTKNVVYKGEKTLTLTPDQKLLAIPPLQLRGVKVDNTGVCTDHFVKLNFVTLQIIYTNE